MITAKNKTDNRVDSTVRVSRHVRGDIGILPKTTREMRGTVLIPYD